MTRSTHTKQRWGGQTPGTHLLGDQVIEQGDHTHGQHLHAFSWTRLLSTYPQLQGNCCWA